ncbi:MAG TPA: M56 family metallopeptidase [Gemmatimonadaceae bacterium]|nr:M56 family metallopeptidase [Gemmatimonadaceae bacterium]
MMRLPVSVDAVALFALVILKASLLVALGLTITLIMRRSSAARRSACWSAIVAGLLLLPVLRLSLPNLAVPVPSAAIAPTAIGAELGPTSVLPPAIAGVDASSSFSWHDIAPLLVAVWALGALGVLGATVVALVRAHWLVARSARLPAHHRAVRLAVATAHELGLTHTPAVLVSADVDIPSLVGTRSSKVVLPCTCLDWPDERLQPVIVHEVAHIARRDARVRLLWSFARAIYWPNPLVWHAAKLARTEQERAADDHVLAGGTTAIAYAEQLLRLAREVRVVPQAFVLGVVSRSRSPLKLRVRAILDESTDRRRISARATVLAAAAVASVAATIASTTPVAASEPLASTVLANHTVLQRTERKTRVYSKDSAAWAPTSASTTQDSLVFRLLFASLPADRIAAGRAARTRGVRGVTDELLGALDDGVTQCFGMRWRVVRGLRELRDTRALPVLVQRLVGDSSRSVRAMAATAIGAVGSEEGARLLRDAMVGRSPAELARVNAAIESLGATPAYRRLRRALRDARS